MLIGYARVSKTDGSQSLDLQHDALWEPMPMATAPCVRVGKDYRCGAPRL